MCVFLREIRWGSGRAPRARSRRDFLSITRLFRKRGNGFLQLRRHAFAARGFVLLRPSQQVSMARTLRSRSPNHLSAPVDVAKALIRPPKSRNVRLRRKYVVRVAFQKSRGIVKR